MRSIPASKFARSADHKETSASKRVRGRSCQPLVFKMHQPRSLVVSRHGSRPRGCDTNSFDEWYQRAIRSWTSYKTGGQTGCFLSLLNKGDVPSVTRVYPRPVPCSFADTLPRNRTPHPIPKYLQDAVSRFILIKLCSRPFGSRIA